MQELLNVQVSSVVRNSEVGAPVLILKPIESCSCSYVPIFIGENEAHVIELFLDNVILPRPLSHDLIGNLLNFANIEVQEVIIKSMEKDVYFADLVLINNEGEKMIVDCRPSDAIIIALKTSCNIRVSKDIVQGNIVRDYLSLILQEDYNHSLC